jgi:putative ABC transport system permease protein
MLKNYFKTALRSLNRNKSYMIINIAGLAVGIAICLIIFIVIKFELSYDNFHTKKDRIYRVLTEYHHKDAANVFYGSAVPNAMPKGLKTAFPQIEKVTAIYTNGNDQIQAMGIDGKPEKIFKEEKGVFFAEPSFFGIFDFPWLAGNPLTALKDPNTAVLTKEIAEKYFGDWKTAVGKTIKWKNIYTIKITGILATIPANTDFPLKVVISYGTGFTSEISKSSDWGNTNGSFGCYILLPPGLSAFSFNSQLRAFSKKVEPENDNDSHIIQPLSEVHSDELKIGNYSGKTFSPQLIRALWLIAAFILLIACVNFINLSTAQAINRAKEIGVRKVLGGNKGQLKMQFITETFLIVVSAVVLSIVISFIVMPIISNILSVSLEFNIIQNPSILLFLFIVTLVVTPLAGFYPSVVLSGFDPINALKSKLSSKTLKGISLRRGLVVFQFIIAQALIICTLIIMRQMNYFSNQPLGFDKSNIVNVPFPDDSVSTSKLDYLRKELSEVKDIQKISFSSTTPVEDDDDNWTTLSFSNSAKETDFYSIIKFTDEQYLPTYKLPLVAGRNLEASDTAREFLVDELLLKNLGIRDPKDALNKQISIWNGRIKGPIVGVLKEFNSRSFRRDLAPILMTTLRKGYNNAGIKLASNDMPSTMKSVEKIWRQTFPEFVFEYKFLYSKIDSFYKQERQLSELYRIFAAIAIFLSCLGLYGLASFMAAQRIKEVGIRKVLGATAGHIVYLFSKEFILLIAIAFFIATPIAWYFMHQWLQDYPFRIELYWWIFMAGGIASIVIALITVSFQAIKAAVANPMKNLRTE